MIEKNNRVLEKEKMKGLIEEEIALAKNLGWLW